MLGLSFEGAVDGTLARFAAHAITEGVSELPFLVGAVAKASDADDVEILGLVNDTIPVMGLVHSRPAKIFFLSDTNAPEFVPQPFIDNLIAWGF